MSSLTTLFNVGAEEYVEFNESLGSKAFLEHVWDQETTPLKQGGELAPALKAKTTVCSYSLTPSSAYRNRRLAATLRRGAPLLL